MFGLLDKPEIPVDPRFLIDPFEPAYLKLHESGEIEARVDAALRELEDCCACPRDCHVNRLKDETRVCNTGRYARVASAFPHFGEEDCLRGWRGSGTIFFSLCNLRCVFCQNWDISQAPKGEECTPGRIADLMLELQDRGCHNVNFVTPEHVAPQVIEAIAEAVPRGLSVPIVYNTSAYDAIASLKLLDGLIDIYMPDFKFWDRTTARNLAKAKDYPDRAREAIQEMHRQVGPLKFGPDGLARRGGVATAGSLSRLSPGSELPIPPCRVAEQDRASPGTWSCRDSSTRPPRSSSGSPKSSRGTPGSTSWVSTGRSTKSARSRKTAARCIRTSTAGRSRERSSPRTRPPARRDCGALTNGGGLALAYELQGVELIPGGREVEPERASRKGAKWPAEWERSKDEETSREIIRFTSSPATDQHPYSPARP